MLQGATSLIARDNQRKAHLIADLPAAAMHQTSEDCISLYRTFESRSEAFILVNSHLSRCLLFHSPYSVRRWVGSSTICLIHYWMWTGYAPRTSGELVCRTGDQPTRTMSWAL